MSALMLISSHAKKGKRVKGQRLVSKEISQCQADLSVLGNLSHWRQSAAMEKNKISPFIVSSFSSPKRSQIWENFFPLLSTCTYDVSEILLNLLSQGISQLSLINKAHLYSWSLEFDFYFWTTECNPKIWSLNFAPRKEDKSFTRSQISK